MALNKITPSANTLGHLKLSSMIKTSSLRRLNDNQIDNHKTDIWRHPLLSANKIIIQKVPLLTELIVFNFWKSCTCQKSLFTYRGIFSICYGCWWNSPGIIFFRSTSLPQASTRWVQLILSSLCPLFKAVSSIIPCSIKIIFGGKLRIRPGAAEWEASMLPLCYAAPPAKYIFVRPVL